MPRTKIPKNSKRNREEAKREEKIRNYELKMDSLLTSVDDWEQKIITKVDSGIKMIQSRLQTELAEMKMSDFLEVLTELAHFGDFKASDVTMATTLGSQSICNTTGRQSATQVASLINRNDEGYLTEDSSLSASGSATSTGSTLASYTGSMLRSAKAMRTPGPLHSARARRARRSRSACGEINLNLLPSAKPQANTSAANAEHSSRSKMRTPVAARPKAFSADRTPKMLNKARSTSPSTPPMAFLRWPKPGEVALSKFGSPIVAQSMPSNSIANVNIPTRNGVLSLRPKKLGEINAELIESLDAGTLHQIRTLHENLQLIVHTANKAGFK